MASDPAQTEVTDGDELFKKASRSIADAETFMSKAKPGIERAKASKENRNKVVAKASEVVNALLEPASKVADLLKFVGTFYPPCGAAGSILQGIVDVETGRRENDVRIGVLYVEFSTSLVQLGSLKPGFQHITALQGPLDTLLSTVKSLMEEFGQFCESFYEGKKFKNRLKHFINIKPNSEKLDDYHGRLTSFKGDLTLLLTQQAVLITSSNKTSLLNIEDKIDQMYSYYAELKDEREAIAEDFIARNGGENAVLKNDGLIETLAQQLELQLSSSVIRAVKEGFDESIKQSFEPFQLKLQFAIEHRIETSTDTIIREIQNGPYELIEDPDMKAIWKGIAPKESNLKRRQFIDAMVYYFNTQWKQFKLESKANRDDYWVRSIISKVYYQPAIGDAIDDGNEFILCWVTYVSLSTPDASGYISVEEINEFMQLKPSGWTTPQWVAYWAYGWDADNLHYQEQINKSYKQLEGLGEKSGSKKEKIREYLADTQEDIQRIANSLFTLDGLDTTADTQMKKLQEEWRSLECSKIRRRLKKVHFKIEYDSMAAVCGSDRIEATLLPLLSHVLARHIHVMSEEEVKVEDIEEAKNTMRNILDVVTYRIIKLRHIWRRQRKDVDVQIRYYVNGLFQDYYKAHLKEFETDSEEGDKFSDWDSEDEWNSSEDDKANVRGSLEAPTEARDSAEPERRSKGSS
ncbi:hypothetical protein SCHPADRAFT_891325 [Schizopora paradoxa]|uniref:EF-hand domain-containing protein n=1 Tax=Schizopora paradoxa TaxID=27342 RepID=A0A0H2RQN7_9AGAM|nr:hypothetical protein SCHPADRAFT_891325 [Schizopora paradoxa]